MDSFCLEHLALPIKKQLTIRGSGGCFFLSWAPSCGALSPTCAIFCWIAHVVRVFLHDPQHSNGNSHMALGDRRSELITAGSALGCAKGKAIPAGFGGAMRRSHAREKKTCLFGRFFTYSQNIKMAPFSLRWRHNFLFLVKYANFERR